MTEAREVIAKAMLDLKASGKPDTANAYADAILAALSSAGMAVVPVEPSDEMVAAGRTWLHENDMKTIMSSEVYDMYRAMIAAALPPLASGGG